MEGGVIKSEGGDEREGEQDVLVPPPLRGRRGGRLSWQSDVAINTRQSLFARSCRGNCGRGERAVVMASLIWFFHIVTVGSAKSFGGESVKSAAPGQTVVIH